MVPAPLGQAGVRGDLLGIQDFEETHRQRLPAERAAQLAALRLLLLGALPAPTAVAAGQRGVRTGVQEADYAEVRWSLRFSLARPVAHRHEILWQRRRRRLLLQALHNGCRFGLCNRRRGSLGCRRNRRHGRRWELRQLSLGRRRARRQELRRGRRLCHQVAGVPSLAPQQALHQLQCCLLHLRPALLLHARTAAVQMPARLAGAAGKSAPRTETGGAPIAWGFHARQAAGAGCPLARRLGSAPLRQGLTKVLGPISSTAALGPVAPVAVRAVRARPVRTVLLAHLRKLRVEVAGGPAPIQAGRPWASVGLGPPLGRRQMGHTRPGWRHLLPRLHGRRIRVSCVAHIHEPCLGHAHRESHEDPGPLFLGDHRRLGSSSRARPLAPFTAMGKAARIAALQRQVTILAPGPSRRRARPCKRRPAVLAAPRKPRAIVCARPEVPPRFLVQAPPGWQRHGLRLHGQRRRCRARWQEALASGGRSRPEGLHEVVACGSCSGRR
mmetsp:Transcript_48496/g.150030  ORF Transcript_48496/g.150030 Transcript_48496/m.150030 type:complete len:498 (-) Transcript_48496:135-1628(-)